MGGRRGDVEEVLLVELTPMPVDCGGTDREIEVFHTDSWKQAKLRLTGSQSGTSQAIGHPPYDG